MKYSIGDTVWLAESGYKERSITCPHCLGTKVLSVKFGDGLEAEVDCSLCQIGYEPSRGWIKTSEFIASVKSCLITGARTSTEHGFVYTSDSNFYEKPEKDLFLVKEEALVRAEQIAKEHEQEEKDRLEHQKENQKHTWAWNARYHRNGIDEAKRSLAYHESKLRVASVKAKVEKKETTNA